VFAQAMRSSPQTYWLRGRPVMYSAKPKSDQDPTSTGVFRFLRWSLDWEGFLITVAAWHDQQRQDVRRRFYVRHHGGRSHTEGKAQATSEASAPSPISALEDPTNAYRLLNWKSTDIGYAPPVGLDALSLTPRVSALAEDVRRFISLREWFEEHGIPWRRGWLLEGPPGNGKTSFVRGVAVEHDLPVHVFDLASLDNYTMRMGWEMMVRSAPCVALIEDIDAVYGVTRDDGTLDTRANRTDEGVTFDCLLNCIGGIQACDGVALFVTTNKPEHIDPALLRGGRLDMRVRFESMDHAGRVKMARRILGNDLEAARVASDPQYAEMSPADLQERLCRIAVARQFGDAA